MILVNGLYRSGSTVIYNIVHHIITDKLIKDSVVKQHEHWITRPLQKNDINIYSYRDVRTITASLMRKRGWTEDTFSHPSLRSNSTKDFMLFLVDVDRRVRDRIEREQLNHLILRYEADIVNIELGIKKILASLSLELPEEVIQILVECHNIESVKRYVDTLQNKEDKRTLFHPNHVSLEKTQFRDYLKDDSWDHPIILDWLKEQNYDF